jgi:hypothetical protein
MTESARRRSAAELAVFTACFFAVWTVRATFGYAIDESISSPGARVLYSNVVKFLLWVVPAALFARHVRHEPPLRYLGVTTMPTRRQWAWCFAVTACFLAAVAASETVLLGRKHFALSGAASYATAPGLLVLLATPLFEETLFRGVFVKEIRRLTGPWFTVVLTALLFAGVHLPFWIWRNGLGGGVLMNAGGVFVFGLVAAALYLKTSSIWPPTIAHVASNLLAALLVLTAS